MVNFHSNSRICRNLHFDWLLLSKAYKDLDQKVQKKKYTPMTLKNDAKFEEKLALGSKNDMSNLMNFNASSGKSGNFFWLVFSIYGVQIPKKCIESMPWI